MPTNPIVPARQVLRNAEATNRELGHENLGFLSESHGFLPVQTPLLALPDSHSLWDEIAADLPEMFRSLTLRQRLTHMPTLSATAASLPDSYLYRAAAIFGIFAHAYHYVETASYSAIPDTILQPWAELSQRLGRPAPHLSFIDLNIYNWRLLDPAHSDPMTVENLALLIPIVGNQDERRFQCTPIEAVARFTPVLGAVVRAQEAVWQEHVDALKTELAHLTDLLHHLTYHTFAKVNPNAYNHLYIDPVVWGKTVAPLATPFQNNGIPGPSGTAIPPFTMLDLFFGRTTFTTTVGHETNRTRAWFPPHWQDFLTAVEQISVPDYVRQVDNAELTGLYRQTLEAYAGETGLLGRHRLKAYGFLDLSFKAGRSRTLGGFDGGFADRLWDRMDDELEAARLERYTRFPQASHFVRISRVEPLTTAPDGATRVVLDVRGAGIRYQPGDRCAILPENSEALVNKTLRALNAQGDEPVQLNAVWREAVKQRDGYQQAKVLSLATLLTFGCLRPVSRSVAKGLYAITHNEQLNRIIEARAEDQWEFWDLLNLLAAGGFLTKRLWKAHPGEREAICRLVPPESFRTYSISSFMAPDSTFANEIDLTIGRLGYLTRHTSVSQPEQRRGTASNFLGDAAPTGPTGRRLTIKLIHPPRFSLPQDPRRPVVMFAGGTGIAPFRGMLQARSRQLNGGENWLYMGAKNHAEFYFETEWAALAAQGRLHVQVAFSQEDAALCFNGQSFTVEPGQRHRIEAEMLLPDNAQRLWEQVEAGAYFYVCGRTGFAKSVMDTLRQIMAQHIDPETAQMLFFKLVGEDRYLQEIFTTYAGPQFDQPRLFDASEVAQHNSPENGYWLIINGRVYDVSEFAHIHPGGLKIIQSYAGMDATLSYQKAQHHLNPEVDSQLGMVEIGAVRRLNFGAAWSTMITADGLQFIALKDAFRAWVRFLYTVVEMENALLNDYSIQQEQVTYNEQRGVAQPSPYRSQLLLQTHQRFLRDYLARCISDPLQQLWTVTASLTSEHLGYGWLAHEIAQVENSPAAQQVKQLSQALFTTLSQSISLEQPLTPPQLAHFEAITALFATEDRRFLAEFKQTLGAGVRVFETFAAETKQRGQEPLLSTTLRLPAILSGYYGRVAEGLKDS